MKKKIKIGDRISKRFNPDYYIVYENQNLPKLQSNRKYYLYTSDGWVELFYVNGKFYENEPRTYIHSFWLFYDTSPEGEILKGKSLQDIPYKYLSTLGKKLKFAYKHYANNRRLYRRTLSNRIKLLGK